MYNFLFFKTVSYKVELFSLSVCIDILLDNSNNLFFLLRVYASIPSQEPFLIRAARDLPAFVSSGQVFTSEGYRHVSLAVGMSIIFYSASLCVHILHVKGGKETPGEQSLYSFCVIPENHQPHSCSFILHWCFSPALILLQEQIDDDGGLTVVSWDQHSGVWLIPGAESQVRLSYFTHTYTLIHTEISTRSYTKKCVQRHWSNILTSVHVYIRP